MVPHRFGRFSPFSIGLEEELFVVDGETLAPAPVPPGLLDGARFKAELFTSMLELTTSVCADVGEAVAELAELRLEARQRVQERGRARGRRHLADRSAELEEVTPKEPLLRFAEYAGASARRQHCAGLHVHVGVASPEECMGRLEAVLPWLPVLLAVSANSPYAASAETGLLSTRAELLALLPRSGAPPCSTATRRGRASPRPRAPRARGRPHAALVGRAAAPRLGTLEVRVPDQPTRLADTAAFAAVVHALVVAADPGAPAADRGVYAQNRWAAARFGADAGLIHPEEERLATPAELLAELLERVEPAVRSRGSADLLGRLDGLDQAGAQLEIGRRDGPAFPLRDTGGPDVR